LKKKDYLNSLTKSNGELKRINKISPLRYPGGKTKAIAQITQFLPEETPTRIVSPFLGGASLEIAWANNLDVDEVLGFDIFEPLVMFWQVILSEPSLLADKLESFAYDADSYKVYKEILRNWYNDPQTHKLSDLDAAAYYFYNMQLSYGPMFLGWTSPGKPMTQKVYKNIVKSVREFRCPKLKVKCMGFEQSLMDYDCDFVYADPPYLLGYDSTVFKAIYPNQQGSCHKNFDHERFRDIMTSRKGEFIISYNNCGTIRQWYSGFEQIETEWMYSYQHGANGIKQNKKTGKEIIILKSSYEKQKKTTLLDHWS
jgi:DNA adenine methylase